MNDMTLSTRLTSNMTTCRFTADRALHDGATTYFATPQQAQGSPLAEVLFAMPGVTAVKIGKDTVSVTRETGEDWPAFTRPAAAAIRETLAGGKPAVAAGAPSNMPSPDQIKTKVSELLEKEINPAVAGHGGYIELIDVKDATVYIRLGGGCHGCGMSQVTLKQGVERSLRDAIPELDEVLDTTDHASGTNPYYAPKR